MLLEAVENKNAKLLGAILTGINHGTQFGTWWDGPTCRGKVDTDDRELCLCKTKNGHMEDQSVHGARVSFTRSFARPGEW